MRIPRWFSEHARKQNIVCDKCKDNFNEGSIIFFGIKNVNFNKFTPARDMLYCEYICPSCKQKVSYTFFDMTLDQFAVALLDENQKAEQDEEEPQTQEIEKPNIESVSPKPAMKKNKSKISSAEQKAALKMLDSSISWSDWLGKIGAPTEEVIEDPKNNNFRLEKEEDNE